MARVRIVMEAEVDDLISYYPNDPKGITIENVASTLNVLRTFPREQKCRLYDSDRETFRVLKKHCDDDAKLGDRLMESLDIKLLEN